MEFERNKSVPDDSAPHRGRTAIPSYDRDMRPLPEGNITEPDAAVAIVHATEGGGSVLLMRRSERADDAWSGHWSFPGGRREPQDADLVETALRELEEECGVRLGRDRLEESLPPAVARRSAGRFLLVAPFVFRIGQQLPVKPHPAEAADAIWVPLPMLLDPARHLISCVPGRPATMRFPAVALDGAPLWGFTYRLITEWLGLGPAAGAAEQAGFAAACEVLDFLVASGVALEHDWSDQAVSVEDAVQPVKIAAVRGTIPVAMVFDRFCAPRSYIPQLNLLEVRPDRIRLAGLAYEYYEIRRA
jgi:8-oxo-dGTP pyrophosphatase MutT (NUDIX family)